MNILVKMYIVLYTKVEYMYITLYTYEKREAQSIVVRFYEISLTNGIPNNLLSSLDAYHGYHSLYML